MSPDLADARSRRITLTAAETRRPEAVAVSFRAEREAPRGDTETETARLIAPLADLDRVSRTREDCAGEPTAAESRFDTRA